MVSADDCASDSSSDSELVCASASTSCGGDRIEHMGLLGVGEAAYGSCGTERCVGYDARR